MGKYINLNREEINKRVEELIAQYAEHGIELKLDSTDIHDKRQYEIWYGGEIATFEYRSRLYKQSRLCKHKVKLQHLNTEAVISFQSRL